MAHCRFSPENGFFDWLVSFDMWIWFATQLPRPLYPWFGPLQDSPPTPPLPTYNGPGWRILGLPDSDDEYWGLED